MHYSLICSLHYLVQNKPLSAAFMLSSQTGYKNVDQQSPPCLTISRTYMHHIQQLGTESALSTSSSMFYFHSAASFFYMQESKRMQFNYIIKSINLKHPRLSQRCLLTAYQTLVTLQIKCHVEECTVESIRQLLYVKDLTVI